MNKYTYTNKFHTLGNLSKNHLGNPQIHNTIVHGTYYKYIDKIKESLM